MAYTKRVSLMVGLAAVVSVGSALPTQASTMENPNFSEILSSDSIDIGFDSTLAKTLPAQPAESAALAESIDIALDASPALSAAEQPVELSAEAVEAIATEADGPAANTPVSTSANSLMASPADISAAALSAFDTSNIEMALAAGQVEANGDLDQTMQLAQSTRRAYRGVSPAYLGAGGNLGFGDRDDSGVSSMGFTLISKISLGPRFSLRPAVLFTNQSTSFTVPLTYNFNLYELGGFRFQPYVGAGVDIPSGSDVGLLLDAGIDMPISRDFTLNAVTNWRVTSGFGFGFSLGVGYNFPWIFE